MSIATKTKPLHLMGAAELAPAIASGEVSPVALVDALLAGSPEFADLWARHEVTYRIETRKRFIHPTVGMLTLDCQVLTAENLTERLVVFTAVPGTDDAERLALLAVVGTQELSARE